MDPLSEVIRLLRPRSFAVGATDVGAPAAIVFAEHEGLFLYCVASGECLLQVSGHGQVTPLRAGDCVVLPSGRPFVLASDLGVPRIDAAVVFAHRSNGSIGTWNGGGDCRMLAAHVEFDSSFARVLFEKLPAVVRIGNESARFALRNCIEQMMEELQAARPGHELVVEHLVHIALIKVLRFHLAESAHREPGWLGALTDARLAPVISAMQLRPGHAWTVASLAELAAMSRTAFAMRFKAASGMSPLDFLTVLRMRMAAHLLEQPRARVTDVAYALGYQSQSGFSTAFRRVMGQSPRRFMRLQTSVE
jgi:AraC-like DNA-binding protein